MLFAKFANSFSIGARLAGVIMALRAVLCAILYIEDPGLSVEEAHRSGVAKFIDKEWHFGVVFRMCPGQDTMVFRNFPIGTEAKERESARERPRSANQVKAVSADLFHHWFSTSNFDFCIPQARTKPVQLVARHCSNAAVSVAFFCVAFKLAARNNNSR
jgi:hypothetical protein